MKTARKADRSPESRVAKIEGKRLHYLAAGQGPALTVLHGYTQTSRMWRPLIDKLKDKFTIIAPDLPGIGDSDIPKPRRRTVPAGVPRRRSRMRLRRETMGRASSARSTLCARLERDGFAGSHRRTPVRDASRRKEEVRPSPPSIGGSNSSPSTPSRRSWYPNASCTNARPNCSAFPSIESMSSSLGTRA